MDHFFFNLEDFSCQYLDKAGARLSGCGNLFYFLPVFADVLVKKAYDNWMHVIEYDGKALLNFTKKKKALSDSSNYSSNDHEVSQVNLQASFPLEQPLVDMGVTNGGMKFLP